MLQSESSPYNQAKKFFLYPREIVRRSIHERRSLITPIILASTISSINGALATAGLLNYLSIHPVFRIWFNVSFTAEDFVALVSLLSLLTVLAFGLFSAFVAGSVARILGSRSFFSEALRIEFYGVLPYSFVSIPLALSLIYLLPSLFIAIAIFTTALVWQLYIVIESFKEIYGVSASKASFFAASPVLMVGILIFVVDMLTRVR